MAIVKAKMLAEIDVDTSNGRNSLTAIAFYPKSEEHRKVVRALRDKFDDGGRVVSYVRTENRRQYIFNIMVRK